MNPPILLVVDDEPMIGKLLANQFRRLGVFVRTAVSGAEALQYLEREPVGMVLSDHDMPGMSGAQLLAEVLRRWPLVERALMSGRCLTNVVPPAGLSEIKVTFYQKPLEAQQLREIQQRLRSLASL